MSEQNTPAKFQDANLIFEASINTWSLESLDPKTLPKGVYTRQFQSAECPARLMSKIERVGYSVLEEDTRKRI